MKTKTTDLVMRNEVFAWIAAGTAAVLAIPLTAMQVTSEVDWSPTDFIIMGVLLFGAGSLFALVARVTPKKNRMIIGIGFVALVLVIWAHLAVGIVDTWPLAGN